MDERAIRKPVGASQMLEIATRRLVVWERNQVVVGHYRSHGRYCILDLPLRWDSEERELRTVGEAGLVGWRAVVVLDPVRGWDSSRVVGVQP
jgi:hypothetical protein